MAQRSRIGVFGGSFDPPHYGHLALAETARVQLRLDRVLFVPAGQPPHKRDVTLSAPETRAELVQAAIGDNPGFELSRVDLDRPGPHYTADMLARLRALAPATTAWFLLLGEDSLHDLPTWFHPEQILQQVVLAVMPRRGKPADVKAIAERLPTLKERLVWLDVPPLDISATELRRRVQTGLPLRYLVPPAVETCIRAHRLYSALH